MAYEQKDNTGSLFQNAEKRGDTWPDYSGTVRIDNHDFWISGWKKTSKDGKTFLSLAFRKKDGTDARPRQVLQEVRKHFADAELSDDVPF